VALDLQETEVVRRPLDDAVGLGYHLEIGEVEGPLALQDLVHEEDAELEVAAQRGPVILEDVSWKT
jgi:hypothetical protein